MCCVEAPAGWGGPVVLNSGALGDPLDCSPGFEEVYVGSANFDMRSFRLNFELGLLLRGTALAAQLEAVIDQDLRSSDEVTSPRCNPLTRRVGESFARLLSPLL